MLDANTAPTAALETPTCTRMIVKAKAALANRKARKSAKLTVEQIVAAVTAPAVDEAQRFISQRQGALAAEFVTMALLSRSIDGDRFAYDLLARGR